MRAMAIAAAALMRRLAQAPTGEDCFVARLHLRSMEHLDQLLDGITDVAETNTAVVKSQVVSRRPPPIGVEHVARRIASVRAKAS